MKYTTRGMPIKDRLQCKILLNAETGCWEWTAYKLRTGYGTIIIDGIVHRAHRVSYEVHCGEIPDGLYVCHRCDNPSCINPEHLFLGTQSDNMEDMHSKDRGADLRGTKHGMAKLADADVIAIRSANYSADKLASEFGVSKSLIFQIRRRAIWKHI
jgi:hypothetical protein